jgi:DNA-directed RNA polymerase specialized sigma subunit
LAATQARVTEECREARKRLAAGVACFSALEDGETIGQYGTPESIPEEVDRRIQSQQLHALLKRLPEQWQTVIYRHYFTGEGLAEIARTMKTTPKVVATIRRKSLFRLAQGFGL